MYPLPIFLSVIFVVRNQAKDLSKILIQATELISPMVKDYELIIIDNASNDESISLLKRLSNESGLPNLQIYALANEVDMDTSSWVGLENALGDFVAVVDVANDDINYLETMIEQAVLGADIVFAENTQKIPQSYGYRMGFQIFNFLYKSSHGVDLIKDAPRFRILSKSVINFILRHVQPAVTYRHLPALRGFSKINLKYSFNPHSNHIKDFNDSFDRGMRLIVATTFKPMRLVTYILLFGAFANLFYSIYVIGVAMFKSNIAPGWVTLSLQQSGMFFLISLVLLVFGEYILYLTSLSNESPLYQVGQEFNSSRITRKEKLNIEEVGSKKPVFQHNPHVSDQ